MLLKKAVEWGVIERMPCVIRLLSVPKAAMSFHDFADFEKLLADVSRGDRDKTITQSYLTSDTGKVYTMLAHAAGRLG